VAVLVRCSSAAVFGIIVLVASAICFGSAAAEAECVTGLEQPQICGALNESDAVFLADVEDVGLVPGSGSYEVRFRVLEARDRIAITCVFTLESLPFNLLLQPTGGAVSA
jgi:hypothetical protein